METLVRIGLSNAVMALVMAVVVVAVACVWRRPAVLHALWLLVLVKLVTPPLVWVRVPWPIIPEAPPVAVAPTTDSAPLEPLLEENAGFVTDSAAVRETASDEIDAEPMASGRCKPPDSASSPRLDDESGGLRPPLASTCLLCGAWLAGALAWYTLALVRLRRFRQMLRHAVPAPESLRQRTQRLAEKLRLRRCPSVWLVPGRIAPMLWAAGDRPRILFPADLLKQVGVEQQNALLVHELAHLRRRDHWVRWLEFAAAGLYWWNPVLWFARRELREVEEQCCDAWVTSTLSGAGKTYATALLETLDFLSDAPPAIPLLASGVGRVADLKRRLTMIMRGTTPRTLGWRGAAAVVGLGALLLPMLPAWVQAQAPAKAEAKEVKVDDKVVVPDASPADLEKAKAELKALEVLLAQKKADVEVTAARVEQARARVRQDEGAMKAADGEAAARRTVRMIETDRVNQTRIQDLVKQLQGDRAGSGVEVIEVDQATGKIILKLAGDKAEGVDLPPPAGARWVGPGYLVLHSGQPPAIAATETDKRIIELEMKLKSLLSEVEKLRQERKPEPPKPVGGESKAPSYGPAPSVKIPYVDRLIEAVDHTQMLREQAALQEKLRADAERQRAESARLATEARLKMLEAEIARLKAAQGGKEPAHP